VWFFEMKVTMTLKRMSCLATVLGVLSSCSSQEFLSMRGDIRFVQAEDGESTSADVTQMSEEEALEADRENPPVEVAGANLVGDCYFLEDGQIETENGLVECTMSAGSRKAMIVAQSVHLHMGESSATPVNGTLGGIRGPTSNSFVVTDAHPLLMSFVFPRSKIAAMTESFVKVSFEQFFIEGVSLQETSMMKMKVHKTKAKADSKCDFKQKMKPLPWRSRLPKEYLAKLPTGGSTSAFEVAFDAKIVNCSYQLELGGKGFKNDSDPEGRNLEGYVAIVDRATKRGTVIFSNLSVAAEPSLFFGSQKDAKCAGRGSGTVGKWICSDYLSIFADDLAAGRKYFEVYGNSSDFSPDLHIK